VESLVHKKYVEVGDIIGRQPSHKQYAE